jgi:hypothetical protein
MCLEVGEGATSFRRFIDSMSRAVKNPLFVSFTCEEQSNLSSEEEEEEEEEEEDKEDEVLLLLVSFLI